MQLKGVVGVDEVKISLQRFGWPDYLVFGCMLVSCAMIGVYFGFVKKKPKKGVEEADNYLVGGRKMRIFPIAMSLIATYISGITLLGTPTEIYIFGVQYMYILIGVYCVAVIMTYIFLPVFHDLKLTSTYEYLEMRFDKRIRLLGSVMFILGTMAWLPIVIYVPALAFNQVTGINVHLITPLVCIVCIFYTCVGGLKAVVWTDVIQTFLMFGAIILVIIKGTRNIGGFEVLWQRAVESGRIEGPDFTLDPRTRNTFFSVVLGGMTYWLKSNAISQNMIQRYLSLPSLSAARKSLWIFTIGVSCLVVFCCYCGLLIYATYHDCDPLTTKLAKAKDQLLPLLVMDILGDFPGLPGLFVAGVFSAALSSLSTGLNSMSAVFLEDFFRAFSKEQLSERKTAYIMRGVVVVLGTLCVCLVFVVERLGQVLQLSMSLGSITNGPLLGVFTIGVMIPWVEGTGVLVGAVTSLVIMAWICLNAQVAIASGELTFPTKPVATNGCTYTFVPGEAMSMLAVNVTEEIPPIPPEDQGFLIYHISYLWYVLLGCVLTIIVSLIVSFIIGANKPSQLKPNLLAPFVRRLIWKKSHESDASQSMGTNDAALSTQDHSKVESIDLKSVAS
ncbi:sodium-coupled monocarboxylate transporter 1-like [Phlebotomus argentipes]|uniref:sodium-coupled monocarboxylate transporter 1-like n=1 Tax=Phlebotomus argentipes TaxID=94469 RepID=UPI002893530E|nr:sodium-coupled monocarboxylate transporter 1-like [Phlebotomus argentipes]